MADTRDDDQRRRHRHRDRDRKPEDEEEDVGELRSFKRHRHHRWHRSRSGSLEESGRSHHHRKYRDERRDKDRDREIRSPRNDDTPRSRQEDSHRSKRRSRSPKRRRRSRSRSASPARPSRKPLPSQEESYRGSEAGPSDALEKPVEKQKPNFKPTGVLAAETNKVSIGSGADQKSIVLKYHEPAEARKPPYSEKWALYIFKGASQEPLDTIPLYTRSCWLLGRETAVADISTEHPSCSKQHAVFQFRHTVKKDEWGEKKDKVGLYVLDLESANGTFLNGEQIEAARYVQCMNGDMIKFGESAMEYVLILPPKE